MVWKKSCGDGCWATEVDIGSTSLLRISNESAADFSGSVRVELIPPRSQPSARLGDGSVADRQFAGALRRFEKTCETDRLLPRASGGRLRATKHRSPKALQRLRRRS